MKSRVCVEVLLLFWNHPKQQASGYLRTAPSCVFFSERSYLSLPPRIFRTREIHSADIGIVPKSNCFCAQSRDLFYEMGSLKLPALNSREACAW